MTRRPRGEAASSSPSSANTTAGYSAAGSAWAMEPPTVPRLRIWRWPISGVARASSGAAAATSASVSTAASVVPAPTHSPPSRRSMPVSSSSRPMSIRCSKTASRSASIGTRLWPPASTLAPSPSSASRSVASRTLCGRWYANGAGFMSSSAPADPFPPLDRAAVRRGGRTISVSSARLARPGSIGSASREPPGRELRCATSRAVRLGTRRRDRACARAACRARAR